MNLKRFPSKLSYERSSRRKLETWGYCDECASVRHDPEWLHLLGRTLSCTRYRHIVSSVIQRRDDHPFCSIAKQERYGW